MLLIVPLTERSMSPNEMRFRLLQSNNPNLLKSKTKLIETYSGFFTSLKIMPFFLFKHKLSK